MMKVRDLRARVVPCWLLASLLLAAGLTGLRFASGAPFSWRVTIATWAFVACLLPGSRWLHPYHNRWPSTTWPWPWLPITCAGILAATIFIVMGVVWAAWIFLAVYFLLLLGLDAIFTEGRGPVARWIIRGLLALAAGAIPVVVVQVESGFADEEFFVALQALVLSALWIAVSWTSHALPQAKACEERRGFRVNGRWLAGMLLLLSIGGLYFAGRVYQASFYAAQAPGYQDIAAQAPFVCGEGTGDSRTFDGETVFRQMLDLVIANPAKGVPEYGMLALSTRDEKWAQIFRDHLLDEAHEKRFAAPAQSMKSIQYDAALRAYYYPRVRAAFPGLFSDADLAALQDWFAAINRRALTTEWVDWLYGLAFAKRPEGPYENQEIGAGLLALLESSGLADPSLSAANRDYLERNQRGWTARFRNTDDAYTYQIVWLNNAYFQSLYTGQIPVDRVRRSLDWLLFQALPDGAPLRYNHPDYYSLAGIAYAGAALLNDPRYLWLAGRAVEDAERNGRAIFAQPGAEKPLALAGTAPTQGSCLLYGDSGLPNQAGPLAPDKIVFRDGWGADASYLLLNLRFSGWHRYKATNTVTLLYKGGQLTGDALSGEVFTWLPKGRSLLRDKRIPRENLNGLLVPRTGLSAVVYDLTGIGGGWAQDPPQYAEVLAFEPGADLDRSHTRLQGWRGWQHDRWVFFHHGGGPIVVADQAMGPGRGGALLTWQLDAMGDVANGRLQLRGGADPVETVFLSVAPTGEDTLANAWQIHGQSASYAIRDGQARTVTVFLSGPWVGADVRLEDDGQTLQIVKGDKQITQSLPWGITMP